jgi:hypothetical protein
MLRHLVIGAIEIGLIAACSSYASTWVIRHEQPCDALKELEGSDVAVNPIRQVLAECSSRKGICASAEHGDKDCGRCGFSGLVIMDGYCIARPIDKCLLPGFVIVPEHHILATVPPLIQLTEAAVPIAAWLCFAVLLPEQLQR